jgi:hypothetical protein
VEATCFDAAAVFAHTSLLYIVSMNQLLQGMSGPIFGKCPGSRDWIKEGSGNPLTGQDWISAPPQLPKRLDDTDNVMQHLALKKIDAFSGIGHGFYFWNFRTDLYEPQWSYMAALDRGWIPRGNLNHPSIINACAREDEGSYKCVLKRHQIDKTILAAVSYALNYENKTDTPEGKKMLSLTGPDLESAANDLITNFFSTYRFEGVTCDFGGVAYLVEENRTLTDDDAVFFSDDEYFRRELTDVIPLWALILGGFFLALFGGAIGFVLAMRFNPEFNRVVRESAIFSPIAKSKNPIVRKSLSLPGLVDYDELSRLVPIQDD